MKDTLRILVSWKCNLRCPYCCNEQPRFRKDIIPTEFDSIQWENYSNFCITGGEPLLRPDLIKKVLGKVPAGKVVILYSNGILFNKGNAAELDSWGIKYVNIGLHFPKSFADIIKNVLVATEGTGLQVRFHAQDCYAEDLQKSFPAVTFKFWKMNDCDRGNEDRIVLK